MTTITTILLDRDGTLIEEEHYLSDPALVRLIPGIATPWKTLAGRGCRFFLATNQSGIGRGLFSREDYEKVHARLLELLRDHGMNLSGAALCPHAPVENCSCRKPGTGLWEELAGKYGLWPEQTAMAGDKAADIRFGLAAGFAETALVLSGHGREEALKLGLPPLADHENIRHLPGRPGWPRYQARTLGHYLSDLVQRTAHRDNAHRI